jgi:hypothetical protein
MRIEQDDDAISGRDTDGQCDAVAMVQDISIHDLAASTKLAGWGIHQEMHIGDVHTVCTHTDEPASEQ